MTSLHTYVNTFIFIWLVMPSSHLILLAPSPPAFSLSQHRVFSNASVLRIRWPKYWSFSFSNRPSIEYLGLISFKIDWFDLLAVQGTQESSPTPQFKSINSSMLSTPNFFFCSQSHVMITCPWSLEVRCGHVSCFDL